MERREIPKECRLEIVSSVLCTFLKEERNKIQSKTLRDAFDQFCPLADKGKMNKRFKKGLTDFHSIAFNNDFKSLPIAQSSQEHAELKKETRVI